MSDRLATIEEKIQKSCQSSGRARSEVTLIAVSKTVAIASMMEAYSLGVRDFGESKLQEAIPKIEEMPSDVTWHFIGKLQSNKARKAAELFQVIHTLESEKQIVEIEKAEKVTDCLVEVNIAEEEQKAGIYPGKLDGLLFRLSCCKYVRFRGLMTIGPLTLDSEQSRKVFRSLKELGDKHGAEWLSMGMSADYDVAIQEGATHVRVGSALFGERA